jgi:hypothetical protein
MASIFLALALFGAATAATGCAWSAIRDLRARRPASTPAEQGQTAPLRAEEAVPHGCSDPAAVDPKPVSVAAGFSFSTAGRCVRTEGPRRALPWLLLAGGVLMALDFAALALLASLPGKLFGSAAVVVGAYISTTELLAFARALRR